MTVEGLLEERRGYVVRGKTDRVAQVDAELARLGFAVDDDEPTGIETPEDKREKPETATRKRK